MKDFFQKAYLLLKLITDKKSGLLPTPKDERDFKTGIFGWGEYKPKHTVWVNPTLSVKDQKFLNICQWCATIAQKEADEGVVLSVRKFVTVGKRMGFISGDGFSNLRSGQVVPQKWGAEEVTNEDQEKITDWATYSNAPTNSEVAAKHKISSFWSVSSKNDILKLVDDKKLLTTGIDWYNGFNQSGGFSWPWLISKIVGWLVGGHAVLIVGYEFGYQGRNVLIIQNSYGRLWGDTRTFTLDTGEKITMNGLFYIDLPYFVADNYGVWANLDIEVDYAKFVHEYDGKNVKGEGPALYFIQKGQKKAYPDEITYLAYNSADVDMKDFSLVDSTILDKVPAGDNTDIKKSFYWSFLESVSTKNRKEELKKLINMGVKPE